LTIETDGKMNLCWNNVRTESFISTRTAGCILLIASLTQSAFTESQYIVKGTVATTSIYRPGAKEVWDVKQYRFEVYVNGKQWRIDLYQTDQTNNITRRTVGSENGKEIVHLAVSSLGPSFVIVEPQPFPVGNNIPAFVHLWLMYASGSFFTNGTRDDVPPIHEYAYYLRRPDVDLPKEQSTVVLNDQEPRLPRFVAFYNGKLEGGALQTQNGGHFQVSDDFYTNAMYEAWDFKTVGKVQLPCKMRFQYFLPNGRGLHANPLSVLHLCEAQVNSIDDKCPVELTKITLPDQYVSNDLRVKVPPSTNVVIIGGVTLPPNHGQHPTYTSRNFSKIPTLKELNQFLAAGGNRYMRPQLEHKNMIRIILGVSAILPLAVLLMLAIKSRTHRTAKDRKRAGPTLTQEPNKME
jgi:hypothetical protein